MMSLSLLTKKFCILSLSNQNLETVPDFVFETPGLKDLHLEKGNSIHIAERYMLIDRIQTLQNIDGRDISNIRSGIEKLNEILNRRLEEMFLTKAASEIFNEQSSEETRQTKMKQLAKKTIKSGPEVLTKFREYKLDQIISDRYDMLVSQALETIIKVEQEKDTLIAPSKRTRKMNNSSKKNKQNKPNNSNNNNKNNKTGLMKSLKLKHLLMTHSKDNNPKDFKTKIWMCEFEPDIKDRTKTTHIVATCGGDSVCFIDCKTGCVLKKYKQAGEEFYCISWTIMKIPYTEEQTGEIKDDKYFTMLAAAGILGDIKLIDPKNLICFQKVSHHLKPVDSLLFHPVNANWLLSGSEDQTIVLWEIYVPYIGNMKKARKIMTLRSSSTGIVRQIAISADGKVVFAACDDGLYAWVICHSKSGEQNPSYKVNFPTKKQLPLDSAHCLSNNLIAVKRVEEGTIHLLCSESQFLQNDVQILQSLHWRNTETPFLKFNFITGCNILLAGDDDSVIWSYDLNEIILKAKSYSKDSKHEKISVKCNQLRCESPAVKLFNHVTGSHALHEVVGVTDNNVVALWGL